jgi:capsule polysaccharide export protein KpsC/LpsZ
MSPLEAINQLARCPTQSKTNEVDNKAEKKSTNQLRFAAKRNPLHQNQKKHKPRVLKRNRDNNHNPQARRLLYPQISENSSLLTCLQYI